MIRNRTAVAAVAAALFAGSAAAQSTDPTIQRDVNQQQRIEQGLKSGALTTREAGRLEREQAKVERDQSRALQDGKLTPAEKARLARQQNRVSRDIYREKHDAQAGNPQTASSQRMQADVQRNISQEKRIEQGAKSGALTNREAGKLERGQARVDRTEARAAVDGHVGAAEQRGVQRAQNKQSRRIAREKHDNQAK